QPRLRALVRGEDAMPLLAEHWLGGHLQHPDVVMRVPIGQETGVDLGLLEDHLEPADTVIEVERTPQVGDEHVRVTEPTRMDVHRPLEDLDRVHATPGVVAEFGKSPRPSRGSSTTCSSTAT